MVPPSTRRFEEHFRLRQRWQRVHGVALYLRYMVKGASHNRDSRFRIMALTDSLATLTAYSNDAGYETVFVEQLKNFKPGSGDLQ